jgi:hypothetical protein
MYFIHLRNNLKISTFFFWCLIKFPKELRHSGSGRLPAGFYSNVSPSQVLATVHSMEGGRKRELAVLQYSEQVAVRKKFQTPLPPV